jgi:hypothetical protein
VAVAVSVVVAARYGGTGGFVGMAVILAVVMSVGHQANGPLGLVGGL